jgi:hypothetical protein
MLPPVCLAFEGGRAVSDQRGFFTALAEPIAQGIAQHRASPPHEKNLTRAGWGAGFLTGCAYTASWSHVFLGDSLGGLISTFLRTPLSPPIALMIWAGAAALGLLWLWVGVRGVTGPREMMEKFWAGARVAVLSAALLLGWYIPLNFGYWVPFANLVLKGIYLVLLAENAVVFLLMIRASRGNAAGIVAGQIQRTSIFWRTGPRRKF